MKHLYFPLIGLLMLGSQALAQLKVENGANVVITSGTNLVLNDIALNQGNTAITGDGQTMLIGNATSTISSTSSIKNLTLAKTTGAFVNLLSNFAVTGTLKFTSGKLDLNSFDLNLGTTGILNGENESNHITGSAGTVISEATLNAPSDANPGNLGISLTSTANLGSTIIKRGNYALTNGANVSIKRFYDVTPNNNTNLDATVKIKYLDAELNGLTENQLLFLSSSDGGSTWAKPSTATLNTITNEASMTGRSSLNRFTLAANFTTLPISNIYVSGKPAVNGVALSWNTINEIGVSHFLVEKSSDGKSFREIAKITSLSSLKKDNLYQSFDKNPLIGANYYRIVGVDYDGTITPSLAVMVKFSLSDQQLLSIYPNPTSGNLNGTFYSDHTAPTSLQVISVIGKIEIVKQISTSKGLNDFSIDVSALPRGSYYLKLTQPSNSQTIKFIRN